MEDEQVFGQVYYHRAEVCVCHLFLLSLQFLHAYLPCLCSGRPLRCQSRLSLSSDLIEGIVLCGQSLPVGDSFSSSASNLSSHVCVFCDKVLTVAYVSASKKFKNGTQEPNDDDEGHAGKI